MFSAVRKFYRSLLLPAGVGAALVLSGGFAQAGTINVTCGQSFRGNGLLTGDCSGTITIEKGTLALQGHTITGTGLTAIDCLNSCKILGPGAIVGAGTGFGVLAAGRIKLFDIQEISNHTVSGARGGAEGVLRVHNTHVFGNGTGLTGARVKITDSTVTNNSTDGLVATSRGVKLTNCDVRGNGRDGVGALLNNAEPRRVSAIDSTIEDNMEFGIIARNIKLARTRVLNNALSVDCYDTIACADIASIQQPRKSKDSHCQRSMRIPGMFVGPVPIGGTWAMCSLDGTAP